MKIQKLLFIAMLVVFVTSVKAQILINVNLATPPLWGPVGYTEVRYYYLPDIESYYDIRHALFIYYGDGRWYRTASLPDRYRNYDLYAGYKVVMTEYHGESPYENFRVYRNKFKMGYRGKYQRTIGERPAEVNVRLKSDNTGENKTKGHGGKHGGH